MRKDTKKEKRRNPPVSRRLAARRSGAPLGRPRAFDPDTALEAALRVFWKKGYEGTALSDLTEAMGINRPSIYATFGNKEALFRKALDRYSERMTNFTAEALKEPTARAVAERLMVGTADLLSCPGNPKGCLMVQGALACGDEADPIRKELISRRATGEAALRERFERDRQDQRRNPSTDRAGREIGELSTHGRTAGGVHRHPALHQVELPLVGCDLGCQLHKQNCDAPPSPPISSADAGSH